MKFTTTTTTLKAALSQISKIVKDRTTLPVLAGILLEAHVDGGLTLSGTDLETRATKTIPATIESDGAVVLPSKMLNSFVGELGGGEVTIAVAANRRATITSNRDQIVLAGLDPEEFPVAGEFDGAETTLTLSADLFAEGITAVAHAVAPDESRPVLAGVNLAVRDGVLTLAAADGNTLAIHHIRDLPDAPDLNLIVQGKPLAGLVGALASATSVRLAVNSNASRLLLDTEVGTWELRLIEGQFPDFMRIIPRDVPDVFTAHRASLLAAVKLVGPVAMANQGVTRMNLVGGALTVHAKSDNETAETSVDVDVSKGGTISWNLNNRLFRNALESFECTNVTLEVAGPASPMVVHSGDRAAGCRVVMPMHVAKPKS